MLRAAKRTFADPGDGAKRFWGQFQEAAGKAEFKGSEEARAQKVQICCE